MLKKIILSVMMTVLLAGSESIFAKENNVEAGTRQEQRTKAVKKAGPKRVSGARQGWQGSRPGGKRPGQQEFDRYFNTLIKAYRENNREKMGQMLRKMNQFRQKQRGARVVSGRDRQELPKRGGPGKRQPGRFHGNLDKRGSGFQHRGMGRQRAGFGHRDMGRRRGRGMSRQGRGMSRRGRGMSWRGRGMGWQGRGMSWQGRGMGWRGRGMGRQGQRFPGRNGRKGRNVSHRNMQAQKQRKRPREDFDWDW
ncbi:MAG: hypothetical protein ACYS1A_02925 [Planctomycetota bacterium]